MTAVFVTVFCSFASFAQPPKRAQVIGAIYGGDGTVSSRNLKIIPVNNNTFGVYSDTDLELCTRVYLYFRTSFDSIENFSFSLKLLSSEFEINYASTNTIYCRLANISDNNVVTDGVAVGSSIQLFKEPAQNLLRWFYNGNNPGRNSFIVTVTFQNFMLGSSPLYFHVDDLSINGEPTSFDSGDSVIITKLEEIYNTIGQTVGKITQFDPSAEITNSYNEATEAFQNDVDTFSGFINQYNMRTTSERVMFPALLTLSTGGGDLTIILGVCIAACSAGSLIFSLRRLHG